VPIGNPVPAANPVPVQAVPLIAPAIPDPIAEAPHLLWYVAPPGSSSQYGPASAEMFRAWIQEGRVAADSMVWRQDWNAWLVAADVLPQFGYSAPVVSLVPLESPLAPEAAIPALDLDLIAARSPEWQPAQQAGAQPVIAGTPDALRKQGAPVSTQAVIIGLAILVVVLLISVLWLVLR
jgi:hypothetical protein